jgi:crossover junction endodeoxyribonuclease RuvC
MKVVGIDPGISGGLAVCEDGKIIGASAMPAHKVTPVKKSYNFVNFDLVSKFLKANEPDAVYIELVGARPGQGVTSMYNFGFSTGGIHGVCSALSIPLYTVPPQEWKKVVFGSRKGDKEDAIKFCQTNCPDISLKATKRSKKDSDGIADAICISIYGMRQALININNDSDGEK